MAHAGILAIRKAKFALAGLLDRIHDSGETEVAPLDDDHEVVLAMQAVEKFFEGRLPHTDGRHRPARTWRKFVASCGNRDAIASYVLGCDLYQWLDEAMDGLV